MWWRADKQLELLRLSKWVYVCKSVAIENVMLNVNDKAYLDGLG